VIVCICNRISERDIVQAVRDGVDTFDELQAATGVSTYCGCCRESAHDVFSEARTPASHAIVGIWEAAAG
jgi:bacterioferritin-associated ferredoxin